MKKTIKGGLLRSLNVLILASNLVSTVRLMFLF